MMVINPKKVQTSYHIRFNPKNNLHMAAALFLALVRGKYKTAFVVAAIDAYRKLHPYGVDYKELEEIQKRTWHPFKPKFPITENLERRAQSEPVTAATPPDTSDSGTGEDARANDAIDQAMDHYGIE